MSQTDPTECWDYTRLVNFQAKLFSLGDVPIPLPEGLNTKVAAVGSGFGIAAGCIAALIGIFTPLPSMVLAMITVAIVTVIFYIYFAVMKNDLDPLPVIKVGLLQSSKQDTPPPDDLRWSVIFLRQKDSRITDHSLRNRATYLPAPVGPDERLAADSAVAWQRMGRTYPAAVPFEDVI